MSSPEKTIASGRPKRRAAQPPPVGVEGRDAATGSCGGMIRRTPESARQCGKRGARYHHAHDCGDGRGEAGFTNLDQGPMVSVLPPSIHACRPVGDPCSTPSRPRIGDAKLVNHAQGSKGRGHIVARGARDGPAGMPRLVQRAMLALAILAALVVGASARDHAPAGIDGGQTSGALFAAQQVASVDDASSGGLPRVHRARKLIEADPRYGSAVRRVLNDVESGGNWSQVGADIDGEAADDMSGYSVSISADGTRVAIGTGGNDGTGTDAGHVRVYAESGGTWTQVGADIDGEAAGDYFGNSVSMSSDGTRVAIGATKNDGTGTDSGHVRVYAESGGTWTQVGADIDGEAADDWTGWSVSMSSDGTRVAIGAIYNDGTGTDAGHVRVYDAPLCAASADPNKDGSDGIFYCINGGTIGGATGSCTCTPCNAGYEGVSCQTASTQSCTCTQNICSCKLTDGTLTAFWTTNIKGIPYKGYEGYEEYFAA